MGAGQRDDPSSGDPSLIGGDMLLALETLL